MKQVRLDEEIETLRRKVVVLTLEIPTARALGTVIGDWLTLAGERPRGITDNDIDELVALGKDLDVIIDAYDRTVQARAVGDE